MNIRKEEENLTTALKNSEKRREIIEAVDRLTKEWPNLELPKQAERRDLILCDLPLLAEQDRKLCLKALAEEGIINLREATEKVRHYAKALGIDKDDIPLIKFAPNLSLITPAQDFVKETAYVTVPVNIIVNNKVESVNYIITSDRQKIRLSDEELLNIRFYTERKPYLQPRWSSSSVESFIDGQGAVNLSEIFEDIVNLSKTYIDFGNESWNKYKALWIIGTYFHRLCETYPYIHLNGDMESGKTKTLTFISRLAFNGELTFNSSASYVVRVVHNNHSTCCIDEVERLRHSEDQDSQVLIAMLNSGYKKGSFCGKSEQTDRNGQWMPKQYEAFSAKVFASIRGLDPSLISRCIPVIMLKTGNKDIKNREIKSDDPVFQEIRDKLYHAMLTVFESVGVFYQTIKDDEILGREWELWKPILALAKIIDTENKSKLSLYEEIRALALHVQRQKKEARIEETTTPKLLKVLKEALSDMICPEPDNFLPIVDDPDNPEQPSIIKFLINSGEEEFAWLTDDKKHTKGKWVGNALRRAGVVEGRAEQRKKGGKNVKGFRITMEKIEERLRNYEV